LGWAIEMRAVWRPELRGGAWDASFCGEKRGCPSRFMYGERGGFSGLAEGMRSCEGGFVLSAYFVGGDFGAEEATYGMEGGIG